MKETLDGLEAVVINQLKMRTGLRSSWSLMKPDVRKDFLNSLRHEFKLVLNQAPAAGKKIYFQK